MRKKMIAVFSILAAVAVVFSSSGVTKAAGWVDTKKNCTLTISAQEKLGEHPDLTESGLEIELYRVGAISNYAEFTPTDQFKALDLSSLNGKEITDWDKLIAECGEIIKTDEDGMYPKGDYTAKIGPGEESVTIQIDQGLYLVCINPIKTIHHIFTFSPYMAAVPSNEAFMSDAKGAENTGEDEWIYDVTVGVKPEQDVRYGELTVEKHLDGYDETLGSPTFIFQVDAWLDEDRDGKEELVYSNVLSLKFSEEGVLSATAKSIPSGSRVEIKEIYSGAGYHLADGKDGRTFTLMPDEDGLVKGTVSFTNEFDGSTSKGGSVVNHYKVHGDGWEWSPAEDSRGLEVSDAQE